MLLFLSLGIYTIEGVRKFKIIIIIIWAKNDNDNNDMNTNNNRDDFVTVVLLPHDSSMLKNADTHKLTKPHVMWVEFSSQETLFIF